MDIQVLVSAMNQNDFSLVNKMNLKTNAIIINQCNKLGYEEKIINGNKIEMYSYPERGVGRSRNNALMKAESEICLLADEDMIYLDDYPQKIRKAFDEYPDADMIIFTIRSLNPDRPSISITKQQKVRFFNAMKYGACRIAFKREKVIKAGVFFSLMFGGGALYGSGEDTLFIQECLKKRFKIYTYPLHIADVKQEDSSWFTGIDEKYYKDKGALFSAISSKYAVVLAILFSIKWLRKYRGIMSFKQVFSAMCKGIKEFKRR